MHRNTLYCGGDLEVMRENIRDRSVDIVYLDPPFNSAYDYSALFEQAKKDENQAQRCFALLPRALRSRNRRQLQAMDRYRYVHKRGSAGEGVR